MNNKSSEAHKENNFFLTVYIKILGATVVNELLHPLILWTLERWGHEGTETFFHTSRSVSPPQSGSSPCPAPPTPGLMAKTLEKLNNYRENNKGKGGLSFSWWWAMRPLKHGTNLIHTNNLKMGTCLFPAFPWELLTSNAPLISNNPLCHKISSINFSSASLEALKCSGPTILRGRLVVKSSTGK